MIPFKAEQLRMTCATLSCFYFCSSKGGTKSSRPSHIKIQPFVGQRQNLFPQLSEDPEYFSGPAKSNPTSLLQDSARPAELVSQQLWHQQWAFKRVASRVTTSNHGVLLNESSSEYLYFPQVKTSCALSPRHDRQQSDCLVANDKRVHYQEC